MAINTNSSNLTATMLEQVDPKLQYFLVKNQSNFAKLFQKKSPKHQVSAWNAGGVVSAWRVVVELSAGGDYQAVDLNGGDYGTGSMMNTAFMTLGYFSNDTAYNIPALAAMATKNNAQAITSVMQTSIGNALKETALYSEIDLFQDSTGVLCTAGTVVSGNGNTGTTVVYNVETTQFGPNRLRGKGQLVDIVDTGNVMRAVGARILTINWSGNTVSITVGGTNYSPATGDKLVFPGMGPITSTTIAAGSWRNGLYTFNTTNTTGSLLGLSYASAYELACPQVNAANGFLSPSLLLAGKSQLIQRRDDDALNGVIGVSHMAQRTSWYLLGVTISNWGRGDKQDMSGKMPDLVPKGTDYNTPYEACDVTHYVSRYADKSRVDWFNPGNFGWVNLKDVSFVTTAEGQRIFNGRSATTGNPTAGSQFYVGRTDNLYSVNPGTSCVFYNLQIPSGS